MEDSWKEAIDRELDVFLKDKELCPNVSKRLMVYSLEWLSVGYFSALYMAGKKFAKNSLSDRCDADSVEKACAFLEDFFMRSGIGKLKLIGDSGTRYVFRLEDCSACRDMHPVEAQICYFEAGIIAGFLESKVKKRVVVRETLCGGLGDDYCEFVARVC
ncbi:MAG: V4R domain-containing protein [archaeon]